MPSSRSPGCGLLELLTECGDVAFTPAHSSFCSRTLYRPPAASRALLLCGSCAACVCRALQLRRFIFTSVQQFARDAPLGALGRPTSSSQPTWDALSLDDTRLTLYQVTVSEPGRHGLSAAGLRDLSPLLPDRKDSVRLAFVVPPERYDAAVRAVRIKDAPEWASRLVQVVMTLSDDAFDAAVRSACAEAADAAEAVDAATEGQHAQQQQGGAQRKRRAISIVLPAGGGSP